MNYTDKIVLITGVSSDIGMELSSFFAANHSKLILTYYNSKDGVLDFANKLKEKYKTSVDTIKLDLCDEESIKNVFSFIKSKYQKLDILINNAALSMDSMIMDKDKHEFMKVLETNVVGTFLMMKYFDNIMDNGYIFNMSSTDGVDTGNIYSIDYNASKAAINSITKTFALYSKNIIICICPNWVDTKSTRMMDKNYLDSELKRIKQDKLISPKTIVTVIDNLIKDNTESGSIIRIEGDCDVRRID